jgi:hypothetical protein
VFGWLYDFKVHDILLKYSFTAASYNKATYTLLIQRF